MKKKKRRHRKNNALNEYKRKLKQSISGLKGKYFTALFQCALCKHTMMRGYVYDIDGEEVEICKSCKDSIFDTHDYMKILYTPM